MLKLVTTK